MAELLIRTVDTVHADFYTNCGATKRGDVIVVCPDGWSWGTTERMSGEWRLLIVPDMTMAEAESFLGPERSVDPAHPSRTLQPRSFRINLDALPAGDVTAAQVMAAKVAVPPIPDPAILGDVTSVIG